MSTPSQAPYDLPRRQRSLFGPLLLIAIGVLFLLRNFGVIPRPAFWLWFARYWPILLIVLGVVRLFEYVWARQSGNPPPRMGAGAIVFLVFFIIFGLTTTGISRVNWEGVRDDWDIDLGDNGDVFGIFGNHYEFSDNFSQPISATQVRIINNRGDIKITASSDNQIHAIIQKKLRSNSQQDADHLNQATHPQLTQQGSVAILDLSGGDYQHGDFDLELQVPRTIALAASTHHGDLTVSQRDANVELSTEHGDVSFDQVKGDAVVRLRHGSVRAKDIGGNITLDGSVSDTSIADVRGSVTMSGTYWGDMELAHIAKQVRFTTSRTELQLNRLDGEFNMQPDDLRANSLTGPFRLQTRSKAVHLDDISGEVHIENRNATVELRPKSPLATIDVSNIHGEIKLELPDNAGFQLDAQSLGGEIDTDFDVRVDNTHRDATAKGTVGKGGPSITLKADHGTIEVRKQ